jgi:hypothetical protein
VAGIGVGQAERWLDHRRLPARGIAMLIAQGKSYIHLAYVFFFIAMGLAIADVAQLLPPVWIKLFVLVLPLFWLFLLVSQVRSNVALDRRWVARYPAGSRKYPIRIAWQIVAFVFLSVYVTSFILLE